nr:MAG TPA: hypothetical protein [Bacteriophage sp.]
MEDSIIVNSSISYSLTKKMQKTSGELYRVLMI